VLVTNSAAVYSSIRFILENTKRPKVSGLCKMVVKRRLKIVSQLIYKYRLTLSIKMVPRKKNLSNFLTRFSKNWVQMVQKNKADSKVVAPGMTKQWNSVIELHSSHHLGIERTMHVVSRMKILPDKRVVPEVVNSCQTCKQILHYLLGNMEA